MGIQDGSADDSAARVSYLPGYVFLSYVISVMGCATTLELLHRRTAMAGLYNWYLLISSSLTMGGIGIWCMHFIGNRAIVLGDGAVHMQIAYSPTFTAVSFVLAVCVLVLAFSAAGAGERAGYGRIVVGAWLTGSAICGMHYVGQLGIANYSCSYKIGHVAGSAIIAIYASGVALGVFFRWRSTWADSWWRRGISACLLAGAVSGMHWTATTGTIYTNHDRSVNHGTEMSRSKIVIICAVLACVACIILLICTLVAGSKRRRSSARANQLVLSCAFFDPSGRIMVTPDAFLPTRKIVEHYIGRTFNDDDVNRTHPAFLWAFRASRNWKLVKDLVPFMRSRLESERPAIERHVLSRGVVMDKDTELQSDFDTVFKQLFCVAAQELADDLRQPLQNLGMLYDDILATTLAPSGLSKAMGRSSLERGKGRVIFTVRQLNKQETSRLEASGFSFATIKNVTSLLSRRIHVSLSDLSYHLTDMRDYATTSRNFEPGVHLTSWVMRPTIHDHFEVLAARGTRNPLPSSTLPIKHLQMQHSNLIAHMDGWPILDCIDWLKSGAAHADNDMDDFRNQLVEGMATLYTSLPPDVNAATAFCPRPLVAPCRTQDPSDDQRCVLLAFCALGTLDTHATNPDHTFTPLRLFRAQQQVNDGVFDRDAFSKELNQELFYSNVKSTQATEPDSSSMVLRPSNLRLWPHRKPSASGLSTVSQESLVKNPSPFGEIMVHKEVKVDVAKFAESSSVTTGPQSPCTTVVTGDVTPSTYVDELYSFCYSHGARFRSEMALPAAFPLAEP